LPRKGDCITEVICDLLIDGPIACYAVRFLDALDEDAAPAIRQHDGIELVN
jgi:hypothetical protein